MGTYLIDRFCSHRLAPARAAGAVVLTAFVWTACASPATARSHRHEQRAQPLSAETVNAAAYAGPAAKRGTSALVLKAEVLLDRLAFLDK